MTKKKPTKVKIGATEHNIYSFKQGNYERFYAKKGNYVYKFSWGVINADEIKSGAVSVNNAEWNYVLKTKWHKKDFSPNIYDGITNKLFHKINKKLKVK